MILLFFFFGDFFFLKPFPLMNKSLLLPYILRLCFGFPSSTIERI